MLAIDDRAVAFFLDRAVFYFGSSVEADIEAAEKGRKTENAKQLARTVRMNTWLGMSQFRSV
jgi:hypothetical protein